MKHRRDACRVSAFRLDRYELSRAEYRALCGGGRLHPTGAREPASWPEPSQPSDRRHQPSPGAGGSANTAAVGSPARPSGSVRPAAIPSGGSPGGASTMKASPTTVDLPLPSTRGRASPRTGRLPLRRARACVRARPQPTWASADGRQRLGVDARFLCPALGTDPPRRSPGEPEQRTLGGARRVVSCACVRPARHPSRAAPGGGGLCGCGCALCLCALGRKLPLSITKAL